ncbi:glycine cleavage system aminomethyltransferase GcvT [Cryobacterium sp. TmT2-59]|uniref:glycine cleavage system aminomethyltransferase GcvT n=1 Tax=unclassified Cryobacterium TaxID=2649013 RepID=UPI00106A4443|nr:MULTISPECIES: glycine cleavage system aminomethyltransferase GcvT [unclassified Cryobacterium]TFC80472.1 glycine cleavage system aminomethyltransferase GcvT [Cryobacterium sp. TmT2-59]TFD17516.1 glycine cleavage system aminomethyltransferase GcvT [Cryobacterium sp. TMT4-10]
MTSDNAALTSSADTDSAPAATERFSPLHQAHVEAGASFTDFAGWQMPVRYSSDLAEHHAVRTGAGIFDLSHMAEIVVVGPDAGAFLDYALAGKLSVIELLQAKYSLILNRAGGIIDDIVVYRTAEEEFLVVANAGNRFQAVEALSARAARFDVTVTDRSDAVALIAVQGPNSRAILEATAGLTVDGDLAALKYYRALGGTFQSASVLIARTGYTGEDGFELYVDVPDALALWNALFVAGEVHGLVPAGLASRDTLRLEAGMPLYGHELRTSTYPAQAGLGRVVNLAKEVDFIGREASEEGPSAEARVLVGLASAGKRAGRADYAIFRSADATVADGVITSGALSPTLGHPIAMAYVAPGLARLGTEVFIDVRGTRIPATVTALPFYQRQK